MLDVWTIAVAYAATIFVGVVGNAWVAFSVIRSRRPRSTMGLSPSDRLRSYIGLLAVVDLLVIASLFIHFVHVVFPDVKIEVISCQAVFIVDELVKLASLTCITCISFERYLTIAKPFKNTVRKRFIRFTPMVAICVIAVVLVAIVIIATNLTVTQNRKDCVLVRQDCWLIVTAKGLVSGCFFFQLIALCFNYGQIARHLRKKFWQRKSRICTNPRLKQPLVQAPKYMKDTTTVILKIATFHFVCWLPYCLVQLLPFADMSLLLTIKLRVVQEVDNVYHWIAFAAGWLAYLNSALDWIFYAVMNRDLRTIIRETTERRKRSTLSQQSPPSNLHRSLRRQISQSLRFFYSINSYRSACNSFDDSVTSCHGRPELQNRLSGSLCGGSVGALSIAEEKSDKFQGSSYIPAMRTGRAHTFSSSPRTSLLSQDSRSSAPMSSVNRFVTITAIKERDSTFSSVENFV